MKNIVRTFSLIIITAFAFVLHVKAEGDPGVEKSKNYSKTYAVGGDKVVLENTFGELHIITWNSDEIKVDVTITVNADDEKTAENLMNAIRVEDYKKNGEIYFKTNIKDVRENKEVRHQDGNDGKHNSQNFKVNYIVHMPSGARLKATNSFGALMIGDYNGPVVLNSKFGTLRAGMLKQNDGVVVEFGNAVLEKVDGGKVTFKFGQGEIRNMSGDVDLVFEFNGQVKVNMSNEVKSLHIKNNYGKVYINVPKNLSANFQVRSNMGNFKNETSFSLNEEKSDHENPYGPKMLKTYSGKAGSGNSSIKIENEFGKVVVAHDMVFDGLMKSKMNSKTENKD